LAAAIAIIVLVINMFLVGPKEVIEKPVIEGTEVQCSKHQFQIKCQTHLLQTTNKSI